MQGQEEMICSPWRRQLAGVRQHVQACSAGDPRAKKNILAILPPSLWWAGQPQWFPPHQWASGQTGICAVLEAAACPPTPTCWFRDLCPFARQWALHLSSLGLAHCSQPSEPAWHGTRRSCGFGTGKDILWGSSGTPHRWCTQHLGFYPQYTIKMGFFHLLLS